MPSLPFALGSTGMLEKRELLIDREDLSNYERRYETLNVAFEDNPNANLFSCLTSTLRGRSTSAIIVVITLLVIALAIWKSEGGWALVVLVTIIALFGYLATITVVKHDKESTRSRNRPNEFGDESESSRAGRKA